MTTTTRASWWGRHIYSKTNVSLPSPTPTTTRSWSWWHHDHERPVVGVDIDREHRAMLPVSPCIARSSSYCVYAYLLCHNQWRFRSWTLKKSSFNKFPILSYFNRNRPYPRFDCNLYFISCFECHYKRISQAAMKLGILGISSLLSAHH